MWPLLERRKSDKIFIFFCFFLNRCGQFESSCRCAARYFGGPIGLGCACFQGSRGALEIQTGVVILVNSFCIQKH